MHNKICTITLFDINLFYTSTIHAYYQVHRIFTILKLATNEKYKLLPRLTTTIIMIIMPRTAHKIIYMLIPSNVSISN